MGQLDEIVIAAMTRAMQKAEPLLAEALSQYGVTSPDQLLPGVAGKVFQDVMLRVAAENFPNAQLDALKHGLAAFQHPLFETALLRLKAQSLSTSDAFAMATGRDAAIVLAGLGLRVAPFDRKTPRILAEPDNDIDKVGETFAKWKSAYVGYSPCDTPFYMLLTDCVRTMRTQIADRPELRELKDLVTRTGLALPSGPFPAFKHGIILIPRESGDSVSTIFLNNPNPNDGSVGLYAGWSINGSREGAPNNGFLPVPLQFLDAAIKEPEIALWIWRPTGPRVVLN
ncbi:MAG: hypothetical protein KGZ91_16340 [Afipia sp.]|nr:hypothetical protein [Afipia sp.]